MSAADLTLAPFRNLPLVSMSSTGPAPVKDVTGATTIVPGQVGGVLLSAISTIKHTPRVSQSVEWKLGTPTNTAVQLATAAVLPNTPTYANGTLGVGATLTAGAHSTLTVDSVVLTIGQRVLVKNQASTFQNGIYTLTTAGDGSTAWVLTRATDADQAAEVAVDILVTVTAGTVNAGFQYLHHGAVIVVGTDAQLWERGEPTGTIVVLVGNDPAHMFSAGLTIATQPAGTASHVLIDFTTGFALYQLQYTPTNGTGVLDGFLAGKGA